MRRSGKRTVWSPLKPRRRIHAPACDSVTGLCSPAVISPSSRSSFKNFKKVACVNGSAGILGISPRVAGDFASHAAIAAFHSLNSLCRQRRISVMHQAVARSA